MSNENNKLTQFINNDLEPQLVDDYGRVWKSEAHDTGSISWDTQTLDTSLEVFCTPYPDGVSETIDVEVRHAINDTVEYNSQVPFPPNTTLTSLISIMLSGLDYKLFQTQPQPIGTARKQFLKDLPLNIVDSEKRVWYPTVEPVTEIIQWKCEDLKENSSVFITPHHKTEGKIHSTWIRNGDVYDTLELQNNGDDNHSDIEIVTTHLSRTHPTMLKDRADHLTFNKIEEYINMNKLFTPHIIGVMGLLKEIGSISTTIRDMENTVTHHSETELAINDGNIINLNHAEGVLVSKTIKMVLLRQIIKCMDKIDAHKKQVHELLNTENKLN